MTDKCRKVNITGYLEIDVIDTFDALARSLKVSRNSLFEEAVYDLLEKKKDIVRTLTI